MQHTTVTVIGAGQAGLAMSRCLTERSIDHVVLERRAVANSWRTERWDSLRLLTPNWLTRLPGWSYQGDDADGYMTAAEVVGMLDGYRRHIQAPVQTDTVVASVRPGPAGYVVTTDRGPIGCRAVVVATGACSTPRIPALAADLPARIRQLAPTTYRNPDDVDDGRVLVVGASASGVQLAEELARHGREVVVAVGEHTRLPRRYRGMDIHWWMDSLGLLDERYDEVDDIVRSRRHPSLQLVGSPESRTLDLNTLRGSGVELVGRLVGVADGKAQCSGSLAHLCAAADLRQGRLLDEIDAHVQDRGLVAEVGDPDRPPPTVVDPPRNTVDLAGIDTVIWATGFAPRYPFLDPALLDRRGGVVHDGGVMDAPGMYVLGLPFTRRRKSSFIDGVGPDARDLAAHLAAHLDGRPPPRIGGTRLAC